MCFARCSVSAAYSFSTFPCKLLHKIKKKRHGNVKRMKDQAAEYLSFTAADLHIHNVLDDYLLFVALRPAQWMCSGSTFPSCQRPILYHPPMHESLWWMVWPLALTGQFILCVTSEKSRKSSKRQETERSESVATQFLMLGVSTQRYKDIWPSIQKNCVRATDLFFQSFICTGSQNI